MQLRHVSLVLALSLAPGFAAHAQTPSAPVAISITPQPLAQALNAWARQTRIELIVDPALVAGKAAPAVSGSMTPREALERLLAGSGLAATPEGSTMVIKRTSTTPEQQMPEVRVSAAGENAWGPVDGYIATRSATATKTDTPIIETPRSISVITADQVGAQAATSLDEALRYTAGIASEYRGIDRSRTDIIFRGFDGGGAVFTDGMRAGVSGFGEMDVDPYALERVEVLKGPASILYGAAPPGGVINLVTKRPTRERFGEIELEAGSYSQLGGKLDIGGALDADGRFLARLTGVVRGGDSQVDFDKENRTFIAPALTWRLGNATSLTLLANYQKDEGPWASFLPAVGTVLPNANGRIPTNRQLGEPDYTNGYNKEFSSLGYLFEHRFENDWLLRQGLRGSRYDFEGKAASGWGWDPGLNDDRTVLRGPFYGREKGDALVTDVNLQKTFAWGATRHTLLFGLDYRTSSTSSQYGEVAPDPSWNLDVFNPVYGVAQFPSPEEILLNGGYLDQDQTLSQTGFYAQDQIRAGPWALTLGGRYDRARSSTRDNFAGTTETDNDSAFTWQAGLVYLFENGLAPYVSYADSFLPQSGTDAAGKPFDPTTGTQYEAGVKFQPRGSRGLVTVSVYETTQQNVLTADPLNPLFSVQSGEVRVRGFEVEAKLAVTRDLELLAAYTDINAKITQSNNGDQGLRPGQTPDAMASVWATYRAAAGLFLSGGARYTGASYDYTNDIKVPAVTLFDAALRYDFSGGLKGASFLLNAKNLADKTYVASCEGEFWCMYGLRRVVTAGIRYRW